MSIDWTEGNTWFVYVFGPCELLLLIFCWRQCGVGENDGRGPRPVRDKWPLYSKRSRDGFMGAVIIANNVTLLATAEFPLLLLDCGRLQMFCFFVTFVRSFGLFCVQPNARPTPDISNHQLILIPSCLLWLTLDGLVVSCDLPNARWTVAKKSFWLQYLSWVFGRRTNYEMVKNAYNDDASLFHPSWQTTWNSLKAYFLEWLALIVGWFDDAFVEAL